MPRHRPIRRNRCGARRSPTDVRSVALTVLAVIAAIVMLRYWRRRSFIPIVLGMLISYALDRWSGRSMRLRIPRTSACRRDRCCSRWPRRRGVMLVQLRYQATEIVEQLPEGARRLRRIVEARPAADDGAIEQVQKAANELERAATRPRARRRRRAACQRVQVEQPPFDVRAVSGRGDRSAWSRRRGAGRC